MSSLLSRAVRSGASSAVASSSKLSSRPISHRTFHAGPPAADPTLRLVFGSLKLSWTIPVRSILLSLGLESTQSGSTPQLALAGQNMPTAFPEQAQDNDDPLSWDGILNAVPKHRTTHSRKRMRSANKGLKDRVGEYSWGRRANASIDRVPHTSSLTSSQISSTAQVVAHQNSTITSAHLATATLPEGRKWPLRKRRKMSCSLRKRRRLNQRRSRLVQPARRPNQRRRRSSSRGKR